jgi:taurine dioxygenase
MQAVSVSGALGAEVRGLELRAATPDQLELVREWLHEHEVLFFREAHLTDDEHLVVARALGAVTVQPSARLRGATVPTFQWIEDGPDSPPEAESWHTDVTWTAEPPAYALLHCDVVPRRGGDTLWASMTAAYDALSPTTQRLISGLEVEHDNEPLIAGLVRSSRTAGTPEPVIARLSRELRAGFPPVTHPLVRTHPVTGRRALFLGGDCMRRVTGMTEAESRSLLGFLARHIEGAGFQCRWRWSRGDLVIWDERSTVHRNVADHFPQHRRIRRLTVDGDRPFFDPETRQPVLV